jgi:dolichol-phosphate mannosyltransferase
MTGAAKPVFAEESSLGVDLSIMIPAYREGANLPELLPQIKVAAGALTPNYEILIVDTQTNLDDTAEVCAAHGVRHINRYGGNQYGDAIRTGIQEARGEYLLCMDGDGSHSPSYFAAMWKERAGYDIVIGSRYAPGGQTENPAILIWMSYIVNLTFRVVFSIRAKDVTNSFRLYRRSILTPLKLESGDFDILEELLIKAVLLQPPARIAEVPVTFARRKAGESKRKLVQFAFGYLKTLQKLRKFQADGRREMRANSQPRD